MQNTTFGKELKKLRVKYSVRGNNLANDIGISTSYLSQIENDNKVPGKKVINGLKRFFFEENKINEMCDLLADRRKVLKIDFSGLKTEQKKLAIKFSNCVHKLSDEDINYIAEILER